MDCSHHDEGLDPSDQTILSLQASRHGLTGKGVSPQPAEERQSNPLSRLVSAADQTDASLPPYIILKPGVGSSKAGAGSGAENTPEGHATPTTESVNEKVCTTLRDWPPS